MTLEYKVPCRDTTGHGMSCCEGMLCHACSEVKRLRDAAAIAPPVAAGSVDTMQRYELVESQHGTGYMVHWDKELQEDADGEWVKHADAIAWGAQQREAGRQEGRREAASAQHAVGSFLYVNGKYVATSSDDPCGIKLYASE